MGAGQSYRNEKIKLPNSENWQYQLKEHHIKYKQYNKNQNPNLLPFGLLGPMNEEVSQS